MTDDRIPLITAAYEDPRRRQDPRVREAVLATLEDLDTGALRVASPGAEGWVVHAWVKEAILLYFAMQEIETIEVGPFQWRDKIPLKRNLEAAGVRAVPHALVRHGSHVEPDVILMPSYVNIGARVGARSMVDTWATVGSCAQVGREVHVSGGVGIGGVLEPPQARPVIVEDGAFLGSRVILVEGALVEREAVLGAGVVITASTPIIDVTGAEPVVHRGRVPERSVVIPGTTQRDFPAGTYGVPCALIIGTRQASTDRKTSLEDTLRQYGVPV